MNSDLRISSVFRVKYLKKEEIEGEAECVVQQYTKIVNPHDVIPLDIDLITEKVANLTLIVDDLKNRFSLEDVLGALSVGEKTLMIDGHLEENTGRFNFTCAHELGHWYLHRHYLTENKNQLNLFDDIHKVSIVCRSSCAKEPIEWQADFFAGAILMPKLHFSGYFSNLLSNRSIDINDPGYKKVLSEKPEVLRFLIEELAKSFKVSKEATRVRLSILDMLPNEKGCLFG